jgi:hypothetical protein
VESPISRGHHLTAPHDFKLLVFTADPVIISMAGTHKIAF